MSNRPQSVEAMAAKPVEVPAEEALVRRARLGDIAAFDLIVLGRLDRCYRLAWSILLNDADAADAIQDALLSAWRQLPRLRDPSAFDGWLNRIVANSARMARRGRGRVREIPVGSLGLDDDETVTEVRRDQPSTGGSPDRLADRDSIGRAFDRLRADERAILALHYVDERPVAEIARSLGIPTGTAKWRLYAARRALERALEAEA
ncbi:MAG TPA: sigma-70 family RNA polymerase sigma factor [Candidatus Limnocylindrales bacterium]